MQGGSRGFESPSVHHTTRPAEGACSRWSQVPEFVYTEYCPTCGAGRRGRLRRCHQCGHEYPPEVPVTHDSRSTQRTGSRESSGERLYGIIAGSVILGLAGLIFVVHGLEGQGLIDRSASEIVPAADIERWDSYRNVLGPIRYGSILLFSVVLLLWSRGKSPPWVRPVLLVGVTIAAVVVSAGTVATSTVEGVQAVAARHQMYGWVCIGIALAGVFVGIRTYGSENEPLPRRIYERAPWPPQAKPDSDRQSTESDD